MEKPRGGVLRSFVAVVGPAIPVIIGVVLTLLLTISPREASKNFTAWGDALEPLFRRPGGPGAPLRPAGWFNPGVLVVMIGIAVSLAAGFVSAWLQLRETRRRAAALIADIPGELLAKLTASHPSSDGQAD